MQTYVHTKTSRGTSFVVAPQGKQQKGPSTSGGPHIWHICRVEVLGNEMETIIGKSNSMEEFSE